MKRLLAAVLSVLLLSALGFAQTLDVLSEMPLYERPEDSSPVKFNLPAGLSLQIIAEQGEWVAVATPSGQAGWIRLSDTADAPAPVENTDDLIRSIPDMAEEDERGQEQNAPQPRTEGEQGVTEGSDSGQENTGDLGEDSADSGGTGSGSGGEQGTGLPGLSAATAAAEAQREAALADCNYDDALASQIEVLRVARAWITVTYPESLPSNVETTLTEIRTRMAEFEAAARAVGDASESLQRARTQIRNRDLDAALSSLESALLIPELPACMRGQIETLRNDLSETADVTEDLDDMAEPFNRSRDAAVASCDYATALQAQNNLLISVDRQLRSTYGNTIPVKLMMRRAAIRDKRDEIQKQVNAQKTADELLLRVQELVKDMKLDEASQAMAATQIADLPTCEADQLAEAARIINRRLLDDLVSPFAQECDRAIAACDYHAAAEAQAKVVEAADAFMAQAFLHGAPAELLAVARHYELDLATLRSGAEAEQAARDQLQQVQALLAAKKREEAIVALEAVVQIENLPACLREQLATLLKDIAGD